MKNGKELADACEKMAEMKQHNVGLAFKIQRYEVPIGLAFEMDGEDMFVSLASNVLSKFDSR